MRQIRGKTVTRATAFFISKLPNRLKSFEREHSLSLSSCCCPFLLASKSRPLCQKLASLCPRQPSFPRHSGHGRRSCRTAFGCLVAFCAIKSKTPTFAHFCFLAEALSLFLFLPLSFSPLITLWLILRE